MNAPIINIIKPAERIFNKVNESIGENENILRLMTNTFNTLQWLIAVPVGNKKLQSFSLITERTTEEGEKVFDFEESLIKVIEIAHSVIGFNDKEFGASINIILEANQNKTESAERPLILAGNPRVR